MTLPAITWLLSPYRNARDSRYPIRAEVKHRIVGTLPSARGAFGVDPNGIPRKASTHFAIGYVNGRLTIDQYVDLSDMAWGNGDVREPTWSRIIPGVNPNLYTVSTEHEDGGTANRGRVSAEVWQASMELSVLLRCGDVARIRAAGIHVRDPQTVAQLAAMPIDTASYIDHHQIAGPNKPYCFRRWLDDPGFVEGSPSRRDRLLAYLKAPEEEEEVADLSTFTPIVNRRATIAKGAAARKQPAFDRLDYDAHLIVIEPNQRTRTAVGWVTGTPIVQRDGTVVDARTDWLMADSDSNGAIFYHIRDIIGMAPIEEAATDPAAVTAAVKAATDPLVERLTRAHETAELLVQLTS